jgi:hypothetical protein
VLNQDVIFEHRDLGALAPLPHDHHAVDGLPARQELGLAQDRRPGPSLLATVAPALPLGFQPGGPGDALHLVACRARLADLDDHVRLVADVVGPGRALATPPAPTAGGGAVVVLFLLGDRLGVLGRDGLALTVAVAVDLVVGSAPAPTPPAATPAAPASGGAVVVVLVVVGRFRVDGVDLLDLFDLGLGRFRLGLGRAPAPPPPGARRRLTRRLGVHLVGDDRSIARRLFLDRRGTGTPRPDGGDLLDRGLGRHEQHGGDGCRPATRAGRRRLGRFRPGGRGGLCDRLCDRLRDWLCDRLRGELRGCLGGRLGGRRFDQDRSGRGRPATGAPHGLGCRLGCRFGRNAGSVHLRRNVGFRGRIGGGFGGFGTRLRSAHLGGGRLGRPATPRAWRRLGDGLNRLDGDLRLDRGTRLRPGTGRDLRLGGRRRGLGHTATTPPNRRHDRLHDRLGIRLCSRLDHRLGIRLGIRLCGRLGTDAGDRLGALAGGSTSGHGNGRLNGSRRHSSSPPTSPRPHRRLSRRFSRRFSGRADSRLGGHRITTSPDPRPSTRVTRHIVGRGGPRHRLSAGPGNRPDHGLSAGLDRQLGVGVLGGLVDRRPGWWIPTGRVCRAVDRGRRRDITVGRVGG